ncbi:uncharacterized protein TM35_000012810 [Trypanosoma theileri]|uniref:Uncharacterized protein n=1 Tax=Trypanosoma theileri TaxID=67003 RepID=A0A1X0P8Z9_9TRYP|nr:uncharacterized protein TM35_000012810 [Trypanosoma theileri]ORC93404.1 hypothetical protein TM35_000012810 [Trypanosoma theileri]
MPKALRGPIETVIKKQPKCSSTSHPVTVFSPQRPLFSSSGKVLVTKTLITLWNRLLGSYQAESTKEIFPFLYAEQDSQSIDDNTGIDVADNEKWQIGFGSNASVGEMIFHLYYTLSDVDTAAWVIAFCIIDKLQLQHSVNNHLRLSSNSSSCNETSFRFHLGNKWRNLFVAFCLALKWHTDYNITLNYMIDLLPHSSQDRQQLRKLSALTERRMCYSLGYNVFVSPENLLQLLEQFLACEERICLMEDITNDSSLGRFFL